MILNPQNRHQAQKLKLLPKVGIVIQPSRRIPLQKRIIIDPHREHRARTLIHKLKIPIPQRPPPKRLVVRARPRKLASRVRKAVLAARKRVARQLGPASLIFVLVGVVWVAEDQISGLAGPHRFGLAGGYDGVVGQHDVDAGPFPGRVRV